MQVYLIDNGCSWAGSNNDMSDGKSLASNHQWKLDPNNGAVGNNLSINNKSGF